MEGGQQEEEGVQGEEGEDEVAGKAPVQERKAQMREKFCDVSRRAVMAAVVPHPMAEEVATRSASAVPQHTLLLEFHQPPPPTTNGPLCQQLLPARATQMSPPRFRYNKEKRLSPSARAYNSSNNNNARE